MSGDRWHWGQKAQQLKFNQLEAARKQAESWRTGLTGITALFGAVLVVKGRDNVTAVAAPYPAIVLALFGMALAALVVATLAALRAASGVPGDECLLTAEDLQAWSQRETREVYRWITAARRLTIAGVLLVAAGVATAWFAPAKPPDLPLVRVDAPAGQLCGRMLQLGDGILRVEEVGTGARTNHVIPIVDVMRFSVVTSC
jgi:hypothetical protein